jgi:endonuclease/exonuclease/phosphatase family metal-dependent hydrolase
MPTILDPPPARVAGELADLDERLDAEIPGRRVDRNLLIASWNLRAFGGLTEKWVAGDDDSPKRDLAGLRAIGQIVSRFDVIALQEVRGDLRALRRLLAWLNRAGDTWGLLLTDVTRGAAGNDERMAFLYDTRRVKPSGLACELVVPPERDDIEPGAFGRQFARTPYACSFYGAGDTFILVTAHVLYGKNPTQRVGELRAIAGWLAEWAGSVNAYHQNLIVLGDFNIDRKDDPLYQAFTSTGLTVPAALHAVPRTIFGSPTDRHYDQIAWFAEAKGRIPKLSLTPTGQAGSFRFTDIVHRHLTPAQMSWRVSDHLPLWVEFAH